MIRSFYVLCLAACVGTPLAAFAQQAPPPPPGNAGQPPMSRRAQVDAITRQARIDAFAALTPDHRARVQTIVAGVVAGSIQPRDAARQIDALLLPQERQAVIGVAMTARGQMRSLFPRPGGAPAGGPPNAGPGYAPPAGSAPNGAASNASGQPGSAPMDATGVRRHRPHAGAFLLRVSLTRQQMRALRSQMGHGPAAGQQPQPAPAQ
jgi:hypothetical protein